MTNSSKIFEGAFSIPFNEDISAILENEKVAVVGIVGHSNENEACDKTSPIALLTGQHLFLDRTITHIPIIDETLVKLEGYYDRKNGVIYLHLIGKMDVALFLPNVKIIKDLINKKGKVMADSLLQRQYFRALLLVFSVAHIVLWCHTTHVVDINLIATLRCLNSARVSLSEAFEKIFHSVPELSKKVANNKRPCTPRLLLLFSGQLLDPRDLEKTHRKGGKNTLRVLEQSIEDQIYRLFRRCWVVTNNSANSITALPSNQQFAFVFEDHQMAESLPENYSRVLHQMCQNQKPDSVLSEEFRKVNLSIRDNVLNLSTFSNERKNPQVLDVLASDLLSKYTTDMDANIEHRFCTFMRKHLDMAFSSGFDDNMGRGLPPSVFALPRIRGWLNLVNRLYNFLILAETDPEATPEVLSTLSFETTNLKLLRQTITASYENALAKYKENLPPHYPQQIHSQRMESSMRFFRLHCLDQPLVGEYEEKLRKEFEGIWGDERRGCEQLSLTGHVCQHGMKDHPGQNEQSGTDVRSHSFGVSFRKFCNCGRRKSSLEDSVVLRDLNFTFYEETGHKCCANLQQILFPSKLTGKEVIYPSNCTSSPRDDDTEQTNTLVTNSVGNLIKMQQEKQANNPSPPAVEGDDVVGRHRRRTQTDLSVSGQRFLVEPMLCSASPPDFLPDYPSWSLVCLGLSSLYCHAMGIIDLPGFPNGSNFLHPWDTKIKVNSRREWMAIANSFSKKHKSNKLDFANDQFTVKLFLGTEFECAAGHRFLMMNPRTAMVGQSVALVQSGKSIACQAMPLYHPCPYNKDSCSLGQMMRIHIVTPKSPVNVLLHPRVQPGPSPCPSYFPCYDAVRLPPGTYWVLRLPSVYVSDGGPHFPPDPSQPVGVENGCLLPGAFSVSEVIPD